MIKIVSFLIFTILGFVFIFLHLIAYIILLLVELFFYLISFGQFKHQFSEKYINYEFDVKKKRFNFGFKILGL